MPSRTQATKIATYLGGTAAAIAIIVGIIQAIIWFDDHYVDVDEGISLIQKI